VSTDRARCDRCRHFCGDPAELERASPGLATLSSAHGAVLRGDGLCRLHERYVPPQGHCDRFEAQMR
jgi:hypothetical protein